MSTYTEVKIDNESELKAALSDSGITWENWDSNQAKTVGDLLKEITNGETLLLKDSKTNKLVRIVSAVWVKMFYAITEANKAKLLPPSIREDGNVLGNYYLIETCIHKQIGPTPFVNIQFKKKSKASSRYLTENMVLPHYRGKPLAGKQTKSDVNVADVRSGAIKTALREIKEELNITLPADVFNEDIFVEWYPKHTPSSAKQGGSKCETPARQNKCIQNSLTPTKELTPNSKLVTWEWVKEEPNSIKTNSGAQIPDITQARESSSYPGLNTLYKIIHLRTKSLDNFNWGKKWINAPGGVDDRRPPGLNEQASPEEVIQFYPPPFQPWQQDEGNLLPLCFTVYETPEKVKRIAAKKTTDKMQLQKASEAKKARVVPQGEKCRYAADTPTAGQLVTSVDDCNKRSNNKCRWDAAKGACKPAQGGGGRKRTRKRRRKRRRKRKRTRKRK